MNGTQTRTAGTRAAQLTKQVEDLATILEEIDQRLLDLARIVEQIDVRQVAITKGTADAYDALSKRVDQAVASIATLRQLFATDVRQLQWREDRLTHSLWRRLRWIVTGRC